MKISTKGRYGLEAVLDLAVHSSAGHDSLKNIAERVNISVVYLEQLFAELRRNGVLESVRGAQGGYRLAKKPHEITAGQVIRALEGQLAPVACVEEGAGRRYCIMSSQCVTRTLWDRIMRELNRVADSITIGELAAAYTGMIKDEADAMQSSGTGSSDYSI